VLFLLSGSSGSGKSTLLDLIESRVGNLELHELGERAAEPWNGQPRWRSDLTEQWLREAVDLETAGRDLLVTELVLGEVLAAPSAVELDGIAACLVDCTDEERLRRIADRAPEEEYDAHRLWDFVAWGVWLRFHHADPRFFAGPILGDADPAYRWKRWERWTAGDPRWRVFRLDTTGQTPQESAERLIGWIGEQRRQLESGTLPLSGRWWDQPHPV
jgi:hypothetical protein